jgi:co-chaperonin GroES (HSP10)
MIKGEKMKGKVKAVGTIVSEKTSSMYVEFSNGQKVNFDESKEYEITELK